MKHFLISFLTLALVLCLAAALCACGQKNFGFQVSESGTASEQAESAPSGNGTAVQFNGKTLTFGKEDSHGALRFCRSEDQGFLKSAVYSVCELAYAPEETALFNIHIVYFENKSMEEVFEDSNYETRHETRNGLDYLCFDYDENGRPGTTYAYYFEGTTYTISFVSEYDMTSLIDGFMSNVSFKAE